MRRGFLFAFSSLFLMVGCVNPARAPCLQACSQDKDTCMLNATTSEEIQRCDSDATVCGGGCPQ